MTPASTPGSPDQPSAGVLPPLAVRRLDAVDDEGAVVVAALVAAEVEPGSAGMPGMPGMPGMARMIRMIMVLLVMAMMMMMLMVVFVLGVVVARMS